MPVAAQEGHICMKLERNSSAESRRMREAILDAAEQIMLEEGYAAVSTRRVATRAGVNQGMVYYHFGVMDDLFIELFRRGADESFQRQAEALSSPQPLWALWDMMHDQSHTALTMEFVALANHRKAIRGVIAESSRKFRRLQEEAVTRILKERGADTGAWPPLALILFLSSVSRFLLMEQSFDISAGHDQMIAVVESYLREIEGERR
ncbi:TetR/AcrR family transcriptional regulator [Actinomadura scrupuli]|uniref:TetR/AcrR family transcriptional regulator n=1 Tax=Actinomadura scrupuli TaxID=559629 RepID=UPI003D9763F6